MDLTRRQWIIAALIGLATVLAAIFGWRAAQIGSTAAFDDRQSISETIKVEQRDINATITAVGDAGQYARYRSDYAVAAALDAQAATLDAAGSSDLAAVSRAEAEALRRGSTRRAADAGVFGAFTISDDLRSPGPQPRPFDFDQRLNSLIAESQTGLDSPGQLDPDRWAEASDSIRERVNDLVTWAFFLIIAVFFYTVAEVFSRRRYVSYAATLVGVSVFLFAAIGGFTTAFFA